MADPLRLVLMTFPQQWDGKGTLTLNVVLIPTGDPVGTPLIGTSSTFANGTPTFSVVVDQGLSALPASTGASAIALTPTVISPAASPAATFAMLQSAVTGTATIGAQPAFAVPRIRKALPPSYMAAGGRPPDGILTTTDDDFGCGVRGNTPVVLPAPIKTVSWGQVISYALHQPILAMKLGLLYQLSVTLPASDAQALAHGGYVSVTLTATDPWAVAGKAVAGSIRTHGARIPALTASARALFAALEFPIDGEGGTPSDDSFEVADEYSDGFAKLVHCSQPANSAAAVGDGQLAPASDLGIEIGWDDQQVVIWQNDQLNLMAARSGSGLASATTLPLGVLGYRVDVADVTPSTPGGTLATPNWQSLCSITTKLPASLGTFTGDLSLEPVATQPYSASAGTDAWLPRYFANWRGGSLCEPDPIPNALTNPAQPPPAPTRTAFGLTTLLSYGHTYSFRVRLGDLSGGGPLLANTPVNPGLASVATQVFQRLVPPKAPVVQQLDANGVPLPAASANPGAASAPATLLVSRPLIVYPEVLYTHLGDQAAWRDTIRTTLVAAAKTAVKPAIAGLPDPDVAAVLIEVSVRHPLHDNDTDDSGFAPLYTSLFPLNATTGSAPLFSDPGTKIPVVYIDAPTIEYWSDAQTGGQILVPRGRDVRITVRSLLRTGEPAYFAAQLAQGMAATVLVRQEPVGEPALLGPADAFEPVSAYFFRRPSGVTAPDVVTQLAGQLGVAVSGASLNSPPGLRVVFGSSLALRTLISADAESLTFGAPSELLRYWIVAIVMDVERDWTWDGLATPGFTILRGGPADTEATAVSVGTVSIPRVLGSAATTQPGSVNRSRTRLIYLDAIDPHEPGTSGFPESTPYRWFVRPNRVASGPPLAANAPLPAYDASAPAPVNISELADTPLDLILPITLPPTQVPAIASVGLALSPYSPGSLYASTAARQRSLWIELTEPIANPAGDALFARVLANGADPLLYYAEPEAVPNSNPPLSLDPELMRIILPDPTDNRDGLSAMTQLVPSPTSNVHFLLPLPPGVNPDDPALFGFWTYELRIGHAGTPGDLTWWSTANGRFGSPLRVVGVQHPAPALVCQAGRINVPQADAAAVLTALNAAASPFKLVQVLPPLVTAPTATTGVPSLVVATAPYAVATLDGVTLSDPVRPKTSMWFLLYAQTVQADGASMRNVLIAAEPGFLLGRTLDVIDPALQSYFEIWAGNWLLNRNPVAGAVFPQAQIESILTSIHLPADASLSVLAVELLPGGTGSETAANNPTTGLAGAPAATTSAVFPFGRILRASPLVPITPFC
jgi:hypothetical protein